MNNRILESRLQKWIAGWIFGATSLMTMPFAHAASPAARLNYDNSSHGPVRMAYFSYVSGRVHLRI